MNGLVPIPWQRGYYLTPDTLALLVAASKRINGQLIVTDAWRSYAEQSYYYDQYINHGGNPAANPDSGQRNHMRGAAFDLARTDATVQAACTHVGLVRDAVEPWHWNNPNAANMPIIPTNTISAGGGAVTIIPPIKKPQEKRTTRMEPICYLRNPATGEITLLDYTNMTRRALTGSEWSALNAQGNAYGNAVSNAEYVNVVKAFKFKV